MRILRIVNVIFVGICALLVISVHVPTLPYLGLFGTGIIPSCAPWFILLPMTVEGLILMRSGAAYRRTAWTLFATAVFVTLGSSVVLIRQIHTAYQSKVRINPFMLFRIQSTKGGNGPDKIVAYDVDEHGPLGAAIYLPNRSAESSAAPVLIDVHGGGWVGGTMLDHDKDLRWYADQGWLVVSPEYTLSTAANPRWDRTIKQMGCVMAWVNANVANLGGDESRISMFGDSAGGNLAINAAYLANRGNLQSDCGGLVPHTKAVVATYPVVDAVAFYENQDAMLGGFSKKMATGYTGGSPSQYPSRYRSVASSTYLSKEVPPTLILVGEADHLVPPASTYKFAELAKGLGADLTIIRVPYGEHVFDGAAGSVGNQLVRKATLNFLISHQQPH